MVFAGEGPDYTMRAEPNNDDTAATTDGLQRLLDGRDVVLAAVAYAAERFLRGGSFADTMDDVLAELGTATGVDRAYVFTVTPEAGTWLATQRYEWVRPGIASQLDLELLQGFDMVDGGFERWTELFPRGVTIDGLARDMPTSEA